MTSAAHRGMADAASGDGAAAAAAAAAADPVPGAPARNPGARAQWRALGCEVLVAVTDPAALPQARAMLTLDLDLLDRAASRFRPDSEVVALAGSAGRRQSISPLLADVLGAALDAAERTQGDLDPTLGADLIALGYDRDLSRLTRAGAAERADGRATVVVRRGVDWRAVELDPAAGTVKVPSGTLLDLGATAKARAADRSAQRMADLLGCGVLVSLGGDIAVAGPAPADGWLVRVQDVTGDPDAPVPAGERPALVALRHGGLATSGTTARRWRHAGSVMHHIVDPRTGSPAGEVWRTVSVAAATCLEANIASTTAIIRGRSAISWLNGLGLPARLVPHSFDAEVPALVVHLGGWPTTPGEQS